MKVVFLIESALECPEQRAIHAYLVPWGENAERARGGESLDEVLLEAAGHHAERLKQRNSASMILNQLYVNLTLDIR